MPTHFFPDIEIPQSRPGDPALALATLFPPQGSWSDADYFRLESSHFFELVAGAIEVLPLPTIPHHRIVLWLYLKLLEWTRLHDRLEVLNSSGDSFRSDCSCSRPLHQRPVHPL